MHHLPPCRHRCQPSAMSNQRHSHHWPQNHTKQATSTQAITTAQQSAVGYLYRHQRDTIIPSPPPPWQHSAVVRRWCHSPGPKTRKWHHQRRGSIARAKPQQAKLSPASMMHQKHHIGGEGGGGDVGGVMAQKG
eukprot:6173242-Ditylum_brightwellii.AAC.1